MFLFRRGDTFIDNSGQTFREFLKDGFQGYRPTRGDWVSHINSLFPEARLKRTLEARSCDSLPERLACSLPALLTGVLYDARAFDEARALVEGLEPATVDAARLDLVTRGLGAELGRRPVRGYAERLVEIADGGLERRARLRKDGKDERVHLDALRTLVTQGKCPADELLAGIEASSISVAEIIRRSAI
jgi:glutamate--cysteine ligase